MRKLFLLLLVLFAVFVFINAYAGVVADRAPGDSAPGFAVETPAVN